MADRTVVAAYTPGDRDRLVPLDGIESLGDYLRHDDATCLVVYHDPTRFLADALADQRMAVSAISDWVTQIESCIGHIRTASHRVCMVERDQLVDLDVRRAVRNAFSGYNLPLDLQRPTRARPPFLDALATLLVERNEKAAHLQAELAEYCVKPLGSAMSTEALTGEIARAVEQLHLWDTGRDVRETLTSELLDLQWAVVKESQKLKQAEDRFRHERARLESERDALMWERDAAREALQNAYASTSWRVSAPVRWVRRAVSR